MSLPFAGITEVDAWGPQGRLDVRQARDLGDLGGHTASYFANQIYGALKRAETGWLSGRCLSVVPSPAELLVTPGERRTLGVVLRSAPDGKPVRARLEATASRGTVSARVSERSRVRLSYKSPLRLTRDSVHLEATSYRGRTTATVNVSRIRGFTFRTEPIEDSYGCIASGCYRDKFQLIGEVCGASPYRVPWRWRYISHYFGTNTGPERSFERKDFTTRPLVFRGSGHPLLPFGSGGMRLTLLEDAGVLRIDYLCTSWVRALTYRASRGQPSRRWATISSVPWRGRRERNSHVVPPMSMHTASRRPDAAAMAAPAITPAAGPELSVLTAWPLA